MMHELITNKNIGDLVMNGNEYVLRFLKGGYPIREDEFLLRVRNHFVTRPICQLNIEPRIGWGLDKKLVINDASGWSYMYINEYWTYQALELLRREGYNVEDHIHDKSYIGVTLKAE